MAEETAPSGAFLWSLEGRPIRITTTAEVLASIGKAAREGFEKVPRRGLEVGGVLLGAREGDQLTITDWRPIPCEHARGPGFELSANDEAALRQLLESLASDPALRGRQVLGWFHTHTRDGICLTKSDLDVYNRFFPAPWQIALVVKPHPQEAARAGFFFREPSGAIRAESSYREFVLEAGRRPQAVGFDPAALGAEAPASAARARIEATPLPGRRPEPVPAAATRVPRPLFGRGPMLALAAGLLAGLAVFLGPPLLRPEPRPEAVALELRASGEGLLLEWDRSPAILEGATGAELTIEEGAERRVIRLTPEELATGSVTYYRRTGDVAVQIELRRRSGPPLAGSARFSGPPPAGAAPAAPADDPAELERLERELGLLRSQLEREAARQRKLRLEIKDLERQLSGAGRGRNP